MIEFDALALSLKLALTTSLILLVIGLPLAYFIALSKSKWMSLLESLLMMPLVLPPTVLGFYLLMAFSKIDIAFSFTGLVIGSVVYSFSFAFQSFLSGFQSIDPEFFEVSASLGDSGFKTFTRIALPITKNSIFTGVLLSFAHTLGEFGVVSMIGGNIQGETRTLSLAIYDDVQQLHYRTAFRNSLFLLAISLILLFAIGMIKRRTGLKR